MVGSPLAEHTEIEALRALVERVPDPELPMVSIGELGMVRSVQKDANGRMQVALTPTYSGCPATEWIREQVLQALRDAGHGDATVFFQRAPAWTTDWISESGRQKLKAAGIAPPGRVGSEKLQLFQAPQVHCPHCGAVDTERLAEHGSTPCKALYRCRSCAEPFDHFKCH